MTISTTAHCLVRGTVFSPLAPLRPLASTAFCRATATAWATRSVCRPTFGRPPSEQYIKALRIRRLTFEAGALFAGRMPMTSCFVAGGVTNSFRDATDFNNRCDTFRTLIAEVGNFVVEEYIPLVLALGLLYPDFDSSGAAPANGFGAGLGNYLAWGGFPAATDAGTLAMPGGIWKGGVTGSATDLAYNRASTPAAITAVKTHLVEVITRSRYENTYGYNTTEFAYPGDVTRTEPRRDSADKYSWMKAPRWRDAGTGGSVTFVGVSAAPDVTGVTATLTAQETNVRLAAGVKGVDYSVTYLGTDRVGVQAPDHHHSCWSRRRVVGRLHRSRSRPDGPHGSQRQVPAGLSPRGSEWRLRYDFGGLR